MPQSFPHENLEVYAHALSFAKFAAALIDSWPAVFAVCDPLDRATESIVTNLADKGTEVTDAGLVQLGGLTQLGVLSLDSTRVTDTGLVQLRRLTQLGKLFLGNTQVTDAGLAHLGGLTELRVLSLCNTQITEDPKRRFDDRCLCDTPTQSQADRCPRCGRRYAGRTWAEFWRDTAIAAIPWVLLAGVVCLAVVGLVALLERLFGA